MKMLEKSACLEKEWDAWNFRSRSVRDGIALGRRLGRGGVLFVVQTRERSTFVYWLSLISTGRYAQALSAPSWLFLYRCIGGKMAHPALLRLTGLLGIVYS